MSEGGSIYRDWVGNTPVCPRLPAPFSDVAHDRIKELEDKIKNQVNEINRLRSALADKDVIIQACDDLLNALNGPPKDSRDTEVRKAIGVARDLRGENKELRKEVYALRAEKSAAIINGDGVYFRMLDDLWYAIDKDATCSLHNKGCSTDVVQSCALAEIRRLKDAAIENESLKVKAKQLAPFIRRLQDKIEAARDALST